MKSIFGIVLVVFATSISFAQTKENLKERIQEHYTSIHAANNDDILSHHLEEFSIFPQDGSALLESGFFETIKKMGTDFKFHKVNVTMKHFNAQIYDNVGVATFYLDGTHGDEKGIWRVTAVWVWKNGVWKEAHHHESKLIN